MNRLPLLITSLLQSHSAVYSFTVRKVGICSSRYIDRIVGALSHRPELLLVALILVSLQI
jgi:hypothetical protein